ncbi:hypothetical protein ABNG03_07395 [Halorubrum sp. RMP-47]|uniref:hypothetical protein n=1 Tax=Halorubrum miltondacostae TaxID=3076378 RepID=UPI0035299EAB
MTADTNITVSRRGIGVAALAVASSGCLGSQSTKRESALEVISVSDEGPVASASVHIEPGVLPRLGSLVFTLRLKDHESEWEGSRIRLAPPEGDGESKEYTPEMTEVSLETAPRVPGTYSVGIVTPNPIEGGTVFTQSEIVVK